MAQLPFLPHPCHCSVALIGLDLLSLCCQQPSQIGWGLWQWAKVRDCLSFKNKYSKKKKNEPKIELCCRVFSRRVTIWVHMAVLVQRTICHQAVIFIWVWLFQLRPYVAEFHYTAQKYVFIPLELKVLMQPSRDSMFIGNTTIPNTTAPLYCF